MQALTYNPSYYYECVYHMFTGVQFTNSLVSLKHRSVLHNASLLLLVPISQAAACMCARWQLMFQLPLAKL